MKGRALFMIWIRSLIIIPEQWSFALTLFRVNMLLHHRCPCPIQPFSAWRTLCRPITEQTDEETRRQTPSISIRRVRWRMFWSDVTLTGMHLFDCLFYDDSIEKIDDIQALLCFSLSVLHFFEESIELNATDLFDCFMKRLTIYKHCFVFHY